MARAPESRGMAALHSMESAVSRQANALAHGVHEMEARVAHGVHDLEAKVEAKVSAAVHKLDAKASYRYRLRQEREKEEAAQPKDLRMRISDVVRSNAFEMLMGVVVMVNFLLICYQVNDEAECYPPPDPFATPEECKDMKSESLVAWLIFLFVFIYTFELACRLYVERCAFFNSGWNNLDAVVVVSGLSSELLSESDAISALRILRTVRLFRVFRVLVAFRELYVIFLSIVTTIKSLLSATMLLFALLTLWSLILVEHIHPLTSAMTFQDCPRCSEAFSSILRSNLSLFQNLVTGDSWGQIHVPLIEEHPWTAGLILGACISISFGMMNLVLAIIIQRAQDARDGDAALKAEELARGHDHRKSALMDYCARMDVDNSGMIVLQELHEGYREHEDFRTLLASLDIQEEELTAVFRVLDSDDSGEVSYEEFVEELIRIQTRDIRTLLTFMKVNVNDCLHQLHVITERIDTMQTGPPVEGQECAAHVERPQHRDKHTQTPTARDPENVAAGENGDRFLDDALSSHTASLDALKQTLMTRFEVHMSSILSEPKLLAATRGPSWKAARPPPPSSAPAPVDIDGKAGEVFQFTDDNTVLVDSPHALKNRLSGGSALSAPDGSFSISDLSTSMSARSGPRQQDRRGGVQLNPRFIRASGDGAQLGPTGMSETAPYRV